MEKEFTYEEAVAKLQEIIEKIEAPQTDIAQVEKEISMAMELLAFCRKELQGYEENFEKILNKE